MMETLLQPFQFGFMVKGFWMAAIVSVPTALLSCFLVLKGWALMGDAVSHAVLPGIVLAYILNVPLILGAFVAGMFTAVATGYLADNSRIKPDTVKLRGVGSDNGRATTIGCGTAQGPQLVHTCGVTRRASMTRRVKASRNRAVRIRMAVGAGALSRKKLA
jgi:hypothetical protein